MENYTPHYAATEAEPEVAAALEIAQDYRWSHMSGGRFFCSFFVLFFDYGEKDGNKKISFFLFGGGVTWLYQERGGLTLQDT